MRLAEALLMDRPIEEQCSYCGCEFEEHDSECPILLAQRILRDDGC